MPKITITTGTSSPDPAPAPAPQRETRGSVPPPPLSSLSKKRADISSSRPPPTQNPFAPRPTYRAVPRASHHRSPVPPPTSSALQSDPWTAYLDAASRETQSNLALQGRGFPGQVQSRGVNNSQSDAVASRPGGKGADVGPSEGRPRLALNNTQSERPGLQSKSERVIPRPVPSSGTPRNSAGDLFPVRVQENTAKKAQIFWNPSSTRDTTIHLELGIEEDLETQLEFFSRLKRLGHFREAEEFFQSNLRDYLDLGQVLAESSESSGVGMLLEQGAFKKTKAELTRLRPFDRVPLPPTEPTLEIEKDDALASIHKEAAEKLELNLRLIEVISVMSVQGLLQHELKEVGQDAFLQQTRMRLERVLLERYDFREGSKYSELEQLDIQTLRYWLEIMIHAMRTSNLVDSYRYLDRWANWPYWRHLYLQLLSEERIWEFRDIFFSASAAFGEYTMWQKFLSTDLSSVNFFDKFLEDWNLAEYDESSYLAALDILSFLAQQLISRLVSKSPEKPITVIKQILEHARKFSACIKENNPENMKSRVYMNWVLVEEELARKLASYEEEGSSIQEILRHSPGLKLWVPLPVYIPISTENPGWHGFQPPGRTNDLLQTVLKVSRELEDYQLEAACLQELIFRLKDPSDIVDQLLKLQDSTQGDIVGYTFTSFFKYLLASTNERRQSLSEELAVLGSRLEQAHIPLLEWCRRMIFKTLTGGRRVVEKYLFEDLPSSLREQINLGDFANNLGPMESSNPPAATRVRRAERPDESQNYMPRPHNRPWPVKGEKAPQKAQKEVEPIKSYEDRIARAASYQEDVAPPTVPLTAEALRKQARPRSRSSRSTSSSNSYTDEWEEASDVSWEPSAASATDGSTRGGPTRANDTIMTRESRPNQQPPQTRVIFIQTVSDGSHSASASPSPSRSPSPRPQPPNRTPAIHQELVLYNRPLDYGFVPSSVNTAPVAEAKTDSDAPKKGKTRIPARLVSKKAIIDLEYPFKEEGETIIIQRNLTQDEVDELIKLSKDRQASSSHERAESQTTMNLDDVSIEILHQNGISYSFDADHPKVVTIQTNVPQHTQDILIKQTKLLREQHAKADKFETDDAAQQDSKAPVNKHRRPRETQDSLHLTTDGDAAKDKERRQTQIQDDTDVGSHRSHVDVELKRTKSFPDLKAAQAVDTKASSQANITKDSDTKVEIAVEEAPDPEEMSKINPIDDGFGWGSFSTKKTKKKKKGKATAEEAEGIISPSESKEIDDYSGWGSLSAKKDKGKKGIVSTEETPHGEGIISPSMPKPIDTEFDWGFSTTKKDKKKEGKRATEKIPEEEEDEPSAAKSAPEEAPPPADDDWGSFFTAKSKRKGRTTEKVPKEGEVSAPKSEPEEVPPVEDEWASFAPAKSKKKGKKAVEKVPEEEEVSISKPEIGAATPVDENDILAAPSTTAKKSKKKTKEKDAEKWKCEDKDETQEDPTKGGERDDIAE